MVAMLEASLVSSLAGLYIISIVFRLVTTIHTYSAHSTQSRQIPSFNLEPAYIAPCAGALHANLLLTHQPAEPVTAQHSITRNLNVVFVFISTSCVQ